MNRALKERIARLERRKTRRPLPRIILAIYERNADEIIGYRAGKLVTMRAPGEPLAVFQDRAWDLSGASILEALYRPESRPVAAVAEPIVSAQP